jgi:hypothetical protein
VESIWVESPIDLRSVICVPGGKFNLSIQPTSFSRRRNAYPLVSAIICSNILSVRTGNLGLPLVRGLISSIATGNFGFLLKTMACRANVVVGFLEDFAQNLWLGTSYGLSDSISKEQTFITTISTMVYGHQFWVRSCFKNKKGRNCFSAGNNGSMFSPGQF